MGRSTSRGPTPTPTKPHLRARLNRSPFEGPHTCAAEPIRHLRRGCRSPPRGLPDWAARRRTQRSAPKWARCASKHPAAAPVTCVTGRNAFSGVPLHTTTARRKVVGLRRIVMRRRARTPKAPVSSDLTSAGVRIPTPKLLV